MNRREGLLLALPLVAACSSVTRPATTTEAEMAEMPARVSGCAAIRASAAGAVCEVERRGTLRLWIAAPANSSLSLRLDGQPGSFASLVPAAGGTRATVELPDRELAALEIITAPAPGRPRARGRVLLAAPLDPPELAAVKALRREGRIQEALAAASGLTGAADAAIALQALRQKARLEHALGRHAGAIADFDAAIARSRAAGRISNEADDQMTLAYVLIFGVRDLDRAGAVLGSIDQARLRALYPDGAARLPYYRGLLAYQLRDAAGAGRQCHESAVESAALGLIPEEIDARSMEADALVYAGRSREAVDLLEEALEALDGRAYACQRAHLLTNRGYALLRMAPEERRTAGGRRLDLMEPLLEAARLFEKPECRSARSLANALVNVALGELDHSHESSAARYLERARAVLPEPDARGRAALLEGEGQLALDDPDRRGEALVIFQRLDELATSQGLSEAVLAAASGRAETLERLGRLREARDAWNEADRRLEAASRGLPLGGGRDSFLDRAARIAARRIEFLLRTAPAAEAAEAARRSRARFLRSLAWLGVSASARRDGHAGGLAAVERAAALVSGPPAGEDALRLPENGSLLLIYHPVRSGWAGFAVDARGTVAARLGRVDPDLPPDELAVQLLGPFTASLSRAHRLLIAASGAVAEVELHALPWKGKLLLQHLPVAWTLDLPARQAVIAGEGEALLITDPAHEVTGEQATAPEPLPQAGRESAAVERSLRERGWMARRLAGTEASGVAVRAALAERPPGLLHYAGHFFVDRDPWRTGLPLSGSEWFTVADVVALDRVPARVVLSGCRSASGFDSALSSGLGLAQAFLLRGAAQAVATTRRVPDEVASDVVSKMLAGSGPLDLVDALARAQAAIAVTAPHGAWSAFRALVP